jgi:hypothetical protein
LLPTIHLSSYQREFALHKRSCLLLLCFIIGSYIFYHFAPAPIVIAAGKEDRFVEYLSALFLFSASILFAIAFKKRNIFFLLLALLMLFGACEEISWGQRILGFSTPEKMAAANVQREFTIHNLEIFNGKQFQQSQRKGLARLLEMDLWFKLFMVLYGIVLPVLTFHVPAVSKLVKKMSVPIPPFSIGIFFIAAWLGRWIVLRLLTIPPAGADPTHFFAMTNAASEYYECITAMILLLFSVYFWKFGKTVPAGYDSKEVFTPGNIKHRI